MPRGILEIKGTRGTLRSPSVSRGQAHPFWSKRENGVYARGALVLGGLARAAFEHGGMLSDGGGLCARRSDCFPFRPNLARFRRACLLWSRSITTKSGRPLRTPASSLDGR